jgi:hypothetical protein
LSAATGLDFHHSNIENFNDVMPVLAGMKRKSEERLDAAIRREEEEEEERLDACYYEFVVYYGKYYLIFSSCHDA